MWTSAISGSPTSQGKINYGRHCAVCLKVCASPAIRLCGGCKKRAYCSKDCQEADWSVTGQGQRHQNWCGKYECGEEDVEWEVVPVPGKGLGVVAKEFIPAKYRIIVEPVYRDPFSHPGFEDLTPANGSLQDKFRNNAFTGGYSGLRISRVNHSCRPNAGHNYDEVACVEILFSLRDINPGEEICFSYISFTNLSAKRPTAGLRDAQAEVHLIQEKLKLSWGIVCPQDCSCKDRNILKLVIQGRQLHDEMERLADSFQPEDALECAKKLLDVQEILGSSWIAKAKTHYFAFQVAVMSKKTLPQADKHIRAVVDIYSAICPFSANTRRYRNEMKHPEAAISYLAIEQQYLRKVQ